MSSSFLLFSYPGHLQCVMQGANMKSLLISVVDTLWRQHSKWAPVAEIPGHSHSLTAQVFLGVHKLVPSRKMALLNQSRTSALTPSTITFRHMVWSGFETKINVYKCPDEVLSTDEELVLCLVCLGLWQNSALPFFSFFVLQKNKTLQSTANF